MVITMILIFRYLEKLNFFFAYGIAYNISYDISYGIAYDISYT